MGPLENLLGGIYAYGMKKKIYNSCCSFNGYSFDMLYKPFFLLRLQVLRSHQLDVSQQSQSGMKKIATFCLGILQKLDYGLVACQAFFLL